MTDSVIGTAGATTSAPRVKIDVQTSAVYKSQVKVAMAVRTAARDAGLDRSLVELVNIRVSQINGCAFCLDIHVRDALENGETSQRLAVLPAWRETDLFTQVERAALAVAEALTTLPDVEAQDAVYARARQHLDDAQFSAISWITITMNAFNRISIVSQHPVLPRNSDRQEQQVSTTVRDNPEMSRYEIVVDDDVAGFSDYKLETDRITFLHTEVAEKYAGQGLAKQLATELLDDSRRRGLGVVPVCPYIRKLTSRNKADYLDLVPEDVREKLGLVLPKG